MGALLKMAPTPRTNRLQRKLRKLDRAYKEPAPRMRGGVNIASATSGTRQTSRPLPKPKKNFIPAQSWLAYNWIEKDPDLEFVFQAIAESGWTLEQIEAETIKVGHKVSRYTLYAWCYQDVKRPQNALVATVMSVLGWERPWVQRGDE